MRKSKSSTDKVPKSKLKPPLFIKPDSIEVLLAQCDMAIEFSKEELELERVRPVGDEI